MSWRRAGWATISSMVVLRGIDTHGRNLHRLLRPSTPIDYCPRTWALVIGTEGKLRSRTEESYAFSTFSKFLYQHLKRV